MSAELHDDTEDPGERERFTVTDHASADWAVRKLARARNWFQQQKDAAEDQIARCNEHVAREKAKLDDDEAFFGGLLETWHRQVLDGDERRKTIHLPSGALKARQLPARVEVIDAEEFVCQHGFDSPLVNVTAKPDLRAIKQAVKDGEALPGVEVVPGDVRFVVETPPS